MTDGPEQEAQKVCHPDQSGAQRAEWRDLLFPQPAAIRSLVRPILPIFLSYAGPLVVRPIDVYGNAIHSRLRGHKHEPASFILHEIQEIILTVHFELQFVVSLGCAQT